MNLGEARRLDPLLTPRSVAVIGASANPNGLGASALANLRRGYRGNLYVVNHRSSEVQGLRTYVSAAHLPEPVDLAIVAVPAEAAPGVIAEAAAAGARAVLVFTAGFAETGREGAAVQRELGELAKEHEMVVCGPNTMGFADINRGVFATFEPGIARSYESPDRGPTGGPVAIISQSGGFGSYIRAAGRNAGLGVGWFVTTGNEVDVTVADVIAYLAGRDEVGVLAVFAEAVDDGEKLLAAVDAARERDKALVLMKAGRSAIASEVAFTHTASVVGADDVFDAVCRQYGIHRVSTMEELIDAGIALQSRRRSRGRKIAVVTTSGGMAVTMADEADACELELPLLPPSERNLLDSLIPPFGSTRNPVDVTAQIITSATRYAEVIETVAASEGIDAVALYAGSRSRTAESIAKGIVELYSRTTKPLVAVSDGSIARTLSATAIPTYADPSRAIRALAALAGQRRVAPPRRHNPDEERQAAVGSLLAPHRGRDLLLEHEAKAILSHYGIQTTRERGVGDADEAVEAAEQIGYPVAMKMLSRDAPHRSQLGGVRLGLGDGAAIRRAHHELLAGAAERGIELEGVLVQEMVAGTLHLALGLIRDASFGPIVTAGVGGVLVEIIDRIAMRRAPLDTATAMEALRSISGGRLLNTPRGLTESAAGRVTDAMIALGQLGLELPEVIELDLNPLIVIGDGGVVAADALIRLRT